MCTVIFKTIWVSVSDVILAVSSWSFFMKKNTFNKLEIELAAYLMLINGEILSLRLCDLNITTKEDFSCDGLYRKPKFYYIFDQWIFGPNSLKLVITYQNPNVTTSETKFDYIMSHCQTLIRKSVEKFRFWHVITNFNEFGPKIHWSNM